MSAISTCVQCYCGSSVPFYSFERTLTRQKRDDQFTFFFRSETHSAEKKLYVWARAREYLAHPQLLEENEEKNATENVAQNDIHVNTRTYTHKLCLLVERKVSEKNSRAFYDANANSHYTSFYRYVHQVQIKTKTKWMQRERVRRSQKQQQQRQKEEPNKNWTFDETKKCETERNITRCDENV